MREEAHSLGPKWRIFWLQADDKTALRCGLYSQTPHPKNFVLLSTRPELKT